MDDLSELYASMRPRNVCICRAVSESEIRQAVQNGAKTLPEVIKMTGCCTGCGTCKSRVTGIIEEESGIALTEDQAGRNPQ